MFFIIYQQRIKSENSFDCQKEKKKVRTVKIHKIRSRSFLKLGVRRV